MESGNSAAIAIVGVIYLAMIIFFIVCYWKIWSKAGFNGAWSLLMLVPLVNLVAFAYLALRNGRSMRASIQQTRSTRTTSVQAIGSRSHSGRLRR